MASTKPQSQLILIDSHALIHRAFHAFPPDLTTADGTVMNAVYGFARLLLDVLDKFKPTYVIAAMDAPGPTVRHQQYGDYKANRKPPDDLLLAQIPIIEDLLKKFDIPVLKIQGFEADDVIGTLDYQFSEKGLHKIVVTGDRDLFQLVDNETQVFLAGTSFYKSKLYDVNSVSEKMGVGPEFITDIKALEGDSSDNIPGVAGIGKKGAIKLVSKFGHIDRIFENLDRVETRYQNKLSANYEIAKLSKVLATIIKDVPLSCKLEQARFGTFATEDLRDFFRDMEFSSLLRKLDKFTEKHSLRMELPKGSNDISSDGGRQLALLGAETQASASIQEWSDGSIAVAGSGEVVLLADVNEQKNPLNWQLRSIYFWDIGANIVRRVSVNAVAEFINRLNDSNANTIVTINGKSLLHALQNSDLKLRKIQVYDMTISTFLLSYGRTKQDLDGVLANYKLGYADLWDAKVQKLRQAYEMQLDELSEFNDLISLEMELLPIIVGMECNGIVLDSDIVSEYRVRIQNKIDDIRKNIYEGVGHEFNISSPKQVGEVLFEEKGLPAPKKTKTGNYSTNERILKELVGADPIVKEILRFREYTKLLNTYVRPLPDLVNKDSGRIHAVFNQLGAITGRFSSRNPNMQNIPVGEVDSINMRKAFVAAHNTVLVAFDYSQQELRLLAELSEEPNMVKAFKDGHDIHAVAAAEIFEIPLEKVTKKERRIGKTINFGIVYGISPFGLADRLQIGQKQAADYIKRYFERYPRVRQYYDSLLAEARKTGYVETLLGRRRHAQDLHSQNYNLRAATEREVMNFPLQGSAADFIKVAMVQVAPHMADFGAKLLLQVHDELIFEYPYSGLLSKLKEDKYFQRFSDFVLEKMLSAIKLNVPVDVGVEVGLSWGEMSEL